MTAPRLLIVDDNPRIHEDYRRVLETRDTHADLDALEAELFGDPSPASSTSAPSYALQFANQGQRAIELVQESLTRGETFDVVFLDVRMPPGIDGVQTAVELWKLDPDLQIVLCTAFSDYSWDETLERCGNPERLLILKKPFDPIEVQQMAASLSQKRALLDAQKQVQEKLEHLVRERTAALRDEMAERQRVEIELRHAQKMEAVGQLAAGVAHEINTPIQFVSDSVGFLGEALEDTLGVVAAYREMVGAFGAEATQRGAEFEAAAGLDFVAEEAPEAVRAVEEGLRRVAGIVRAMQAFASSDGPEEAGPADLTEALRTTLTVSAHQWGAVGEATLHDAELPPVVCKVHDLNQAFLQLILNAVHAIEDAGRPGRIAITTEASAEHVFVRVEDNGCGIPAGVRDRIFEPFFTTKDVGRGSGQGLATVHSIVVDQHGGSVSVDSSPDGTVFTVALPVRGAQFAAA